MNAQGSLSLTGRLSLKKITRAQRERAERWHVLGWKVRNRLGRWREWPLMLVLFLHRLGLTPSGTTLMVGRTYLKKYDGATGRWIDYGLAGVHLITTAGKNYVASCFDNTAEPELFKFHGFGTGTTAAVIGDTGLQTELTTQYNPDNTRPTGSQAHSANTYTTVGTVTPDSGGTIAVTEWGLLTATSAGTLLDHQVFSAVNLIAANGDSLQATYVLTFS